MVPEMQNIRIQFHYTIFHTPTRIVTSGLWHPSPLACTVDHVSAFNMNAALVVSQWQNQSRVKGYWGPAKNLDGAF